jgi:hypothetical protein
MTTEVTRPKFDVVRGWAGGGSLGSAYDKTFEKAVASNGTPTKLKQGTFVTYHASVSGACTPASYADDDAASKYALYLVVEGNDPADSYSGDYLDKVVGIRGSYEVLLSETMFTAGVYTVGAPVTVVNGKVQLVASSTKPAVGHVTSYDAAANLLTVQI